MSEASRKWLRYLVPVLVVLVAVVVLVLLGRTFGAPDGSFGFWSGDINSPFNSQRFLDAYTFTHVMHGVLFYGLFWLVARRKSFSFRLTGAILLESLWEIIENTPWIINRYREATLAQGYFGDSILNSFGDILAMVLGFWLASKLPVWLTVLLVIGFEILLLFIIRDNLSLNIILLLFSSDAIKNWQMGLL